MKTDGRFSILFRGSGEHKRLSDTACHDLGLETICRALTEDAKEQHMIRDVLADMSADPDTARFRSEVFSDVLVLPELRERMSRLFERMEFIRTFGIMHKSMDKELGLWHLFHRMEELGDYIECVEAMRECLSDSRIASRGLLALREHIEELYKDSCFEQMKKDIAALRIKASEVRSVTLGINVNERFEAVSMGLISVNSKPFKKSGIVGSFADAIASKGKLNPSEEWDGDMHYHPIDSGSGKLAAAVEKEAAFFAPKIMPFVDAGTSSTIVSTADGDGAKNSTFYLENTLNKMLDSLVKRLRDTLTKYANITVVSISQLLPEFTYYIRAAEFVEKYTAKGFSFCKAEPIEEKGLMEAEGFYNLKLAVSLGSADELVKNDLSFGPEHTVYILTGANRGGKTTVTQAVGILFLLAQGGVYVPAERFVFSPADCIYTHFPADEDKTMDLGRLGEECVRFREIYSECTDKSLMLLNETFSTTSFEEGYYIARDSVKALLKKQFRTIYNSHMHKLALDAEELSREATGAGAASLVVRTDGGRRSFKLELASPEGMSYARDIAEKYGVTFELLTGGES